MFDHSFTLPLMQLFSWMAPLELSLLNWN